MVEQMRSGLLYRIPAQAERHRCCMLPLLTTTLLTAMLLLLLLLSSSSSSLRRMTPRGPSRPCRGSRPRSPVPEERRDAR